MSEAPTLQSLIAGRWIGATPASALASAIDGSTVFHTHAEAIDFGEAVHFARRSGGPALLALDFQQRAARHQDVGAGEAALLAQRHRRPFMHDIARRQFGRAQAGVGEQRGRAAFDVDPAVGARGAGVARDRVQMLLVLDQP